MKSPVRVSILGNSFASRVQLPALRWAGDNRVVGIAGRDGEKAEATAKEWQIPFATDDWRELLEREADLVVISTPVDLHLPMARAALESGAAVLCEKPFTLDATEARDLVSLAEGRPAWLDHELRWSPHLREMRRRLQAGEAGEVLHAAVEMFLPPTNYHDRPWSWWFDARRGGGILGALGSHLVDLMRWLLGDIQEVRATLASFVPEREDAEGEWRDVSADDYASLHLRFTSGCIATVDTSIAIPSERFFRLQVTGSEKTFRIVKGDELYVGPTNGALEPATVIPPLPSCDELGLPEYGLFGRCLPFFLRDVVAAVGTGRKDVPEAATFVDGLATQVILDAARRSATSRSGWVPCRTR